MLLILHRLKNRVRFKVKGLYRNEPLSFYIRLELSRLSGIKKVNPNTLTGSLLIIFDSHLSPEIIAQEVEKLISGFDPKEAPMPKKKSRMILTELQGETQEEKPWHLMTKEAVLSHFKVDPHQGLSPLEAKDRLNRFGPNKIHEVEARTRWQILLNQFKSLPVALLGLSSLISFLTGGIVDGIAILTVVVLNGVIGFMTEEQSEKIILSMKSLFKPQALVLRGGTIQVVTADEVVPGDVLILKPGQYVTADARVIEAHHLTIDESSLTGESLPVFKTSQALATAGNWEIPLGDRINMVYTGTLVTGGQGLALVVATGCFTELGKIQTSLKQVEAQKTSLESQLERLGTKLVLVSSGFCGLVLLAGLFWGYGGLRTLKMVISLVVAAVPEGLPTVATTTLALGVRRMRGLNILVRKLEAIETLGRVQTICLDKTGTITLNKMSVAEIICGENRFEAAKLTDSSQIWQKIPEVEEMLRVIVLCNECTIEDAEMGITFRGTPTEKALLELAHRAGLDIKAIREDYPLTGLKHRTEQSHYMVTLHSSRHHPENYIALKGSPVEVLNLCSHEMVRGEKKELSEERRDELIRQNDEMAARGLRVLGVAFYRGVQTDCLEFQEELLNGEARCEFIWLGLVGMIDPIRPGVKEFTRDLHGAGIETVMITGDQAPTAYAIAKEVDLSNGKALEILDSAHLNFTNPEVLPALCQRVKCFARVNPAHKLLIVQALQKAGKVIAMTGDGINDGPALKVADVGIAMGRTGTDVARGVADVVIEDDDLKKLLEAIKQGRTIYLNIRKSVNYLVSTNLSELLLTLVSVSLGLGEVLSPMQLLWINLITDVAPGLALSLEPPEGEVMKRPPRDPNEQLIPNWLLKRLFIESTILTGTSFTAYTYGLLRFGKGAEASGIAFMSLTLAQILHSISCRSEKPGLSFSSERLPENRVLNLTILGSLGLQGLTLLVPSLRSILGLSRLSLDGLAVALASAGTSFLLNEMKKLPNKGVSP